MNRAVTFTINDTLTEPGTYPASGLYTATTVDGTTIVIEAPAGTFESNQTFRAILTQIGLTTTDGGTAVYRIADSRPLRIEEGPSSWKADLVSRIEMSSPSAVAEALRLDSTPHGSQLDLWRERSLLLGFHSDDRYHYPTFQFDIDRYRIWPAVERANTMLKAAENPWAVLAWWLRDNTFLDGNPAGSRA